MPLKDDLITRLNENLNETLSSLKRTQDTALIRQLETHIDEGFSHVGSNRDLIERLPTSTLLDVLSSGGLLDREKCYLIAALLHAELTLLQIQRVPLPEAQVIKTLNLYLEAALEDVAADDIHERTEELIALSNAYTLPQSSEWRLFEYARYMQRYAQAEDKLFYILDTFGSNDEAIRRGRSFYQTLLQTSDAQLEQGNLPKNEVQEGLNALESYARM